MKIKILMALITFFDLVGSTEVFARANKRYSRARRTKVAGGRGNNGGTGQQKKQQEQNLMEDYRRFLYPTYGKTLEYGQSYSIQDMLRYDVHKYYKEHGSEKDLNEQFCFGPYMKLTSNVTGVGGETIDLKAGDGTICTYIKPNTNYAITLTDATEKQVSNAVKKNATPCMTSADKRRVCITRNGQDLQTMHLTSEMYLDTKPHITNITEAIDKVKTSCGEFTKTMADINKQLGLGVSLTSGFAMALSGAATAVGYLNYKATQEQEEMLHQHSEDQLKYIDKAAEAIDTGEYETNMPKLINDIKEKDLTEMYFCEVGDKECVKSKGKRSSSKVNYSQEHKDVCERFMQIKTETGGFIRDMRRGQGGFEIKSVTRDEGGKWDRFITDEEIKKGFGMEFATKKEVEDYIMKKGVCCKDGWQAPANKESVCEYPSKQDYITDLKNLKNELVEGNRNIGVNHKKSRNLDITTAALSGTSAVTSTIGMVLSIAAIQSVEKSLTQLKQCKKDVNDLKLLNKKYIALQDEADSTGE